MQQTGAGKRAGTPGVALQGSLVDRFSPPMIKKRLTLTIPTLNNPLVYRLLREREHLKQVLSQHRKMSRLCAAGGMLGIDTW